MTSKDGIKELSRHTPSGLIIMEREKQDAKWGEQNHDDFRWLSILGEEFGEVAHAVCEQLQDEYGDDELRENLEIELVQVASVCVAWIECLRRRDTLQREGK